MTTQIHYRDKCIGCGTCTQEAPDVWMIDEKDGKASVVGGVVKGAVVVRILVPHEREQCKNAEEQCPVHCIVIR